jgi:hypothetical protein
MPSLRLLPPSLRILFAASLLALSATALPAAAQPYKWGNISPSQLDMTSYRPDSNAAAVVLFDYGETDFESNGEVIFRRHTRVKILSEGGYDMGTVTIPFHSGDRLEDVRDVRGQTFVRTADGSVKRHRLRRSDIHEEDVDGTRSQARFTLPGLAPGAVIEYRYEVRSRSFRFLRSWAFQNNEPTLHSEYVATIPDLLDFEGLKRGSEPFAVNTAEPAHWWYRGYRISAQKHRWVMKNVPALRPEPFMTTLEDYRAQIIFQLRAILNTHGGVQEQFMGTWPDVARELMDSDDFGGELKRGGLLKRRAVLLTEGLSSQQAKVGSVYDFVRSNTKWTGEQRFFPDHSLDVVFRTQKGSSAEINMLLVAMLRHAGLNAHPVLISTRDHGRVMPSYPFVHQFNGLVAAVRTEGDWMLLDATDPLRPAGLLPELALNGKGWLVRRKNPVWIPLPSRRASRDVIVTGQISAAGTLSGTVRVTDTGYRALQSRRILSDQGADHFMHNGLFHGFDDAILESVVVSARDRVTLPLETTAAFILPYYAQRTGDLLYLRPVAVDRTDQNPLRSAERAFPVDVGHPRRWTYTLSLQLPEGYVLKEQPDDSGFRLPRRAGALSHDVRAEDDRLKVSIAFELNRSRYPVKDYRSLRTLYSRLTSVHVQQIVLERARSAGEAEGTDDPVDTAAGAAP